jgi:hypothetical protein
MKTPQTVPIMSSGKIAISAIVFSVSKRLGSLQSREWMMNLGRDRVEPVLSGRVETEKT